MSAKINDRPISASGPILVAGFGPYHFVPRNPASTLVRQLRDDDDHWSDGRFCFRPDVKVVWTASQEIEEEACQLDAQVVVIFGVARKPRRSGLRLERLARDVSGRHRDNRFRRAPSLPAGSPSTRCVDPRFVTAAESCGVEVGDENSAGDYVCNRTLFGLLGGQRPAVLVHSPVCRRGVSEELAARTLLEAIDTSFNPR